MKKIYIIRHGQTDYNLNGILQGARVDAGLNETGKKQSQAFFRRYSHLPFKKVYTSLLNRSYESVLPFINLGVPVEKHAALNEINYGESDGIESSRGEGSVYRQMVKQWDAGETHVRFPGGESPEDVMLRQKAFIKSLLSRDQEDLVLISMHGRALRIFLANFLGLPCPDMKLFNHSNLCLYLLSYNGRYVCLEKENDTNHLELIVSSELKQLV